MIATSEAAVSVTVDHLPGGVKGRTFVQLIMALGSMCSTKVSGGRVLVIIIICNF